MRHAVFEVPEGLAVGKRGSALALQVRRWAPFDRTRFAAHWIGNRASVYAWDETQIDAAIGMEGENPARCAIWPETFFRPTMQDGIRLVAMLDGVEGQAWRNGLLVASRWWPRQPTESDWRLFQRSAGFVPDAQSAGVPAAVELPLLELPWTEDAASLANAWALLQDPRIAAAAAAILLAPSVYFLSQIVVFSLATAKSESARAALTAASQKVRSERLAALTNADTINAYLSLEPYPPQFQTIGTAAQLLHDRNVAITEWLFDNGNLDLTLRGVTALDAPSFIEAFEKSGLFSDVGATTADQEREIKIKAKVKRSAGANP